MLTYCYAMLCEVLSLHAFASFYSHSHSSWEMALRYVQARGDWMNWIVSSPKTLSYHLSFLCGLVFPPVLSAAWYFATLLFACVEQKKSWIAPGAELPKIPTAFSFHWHWTCVPELLTSAAPKERLLLYLSAPGS